MPETTSLPPVLFNHLYVVLDDKTYRAVLGSDFLRTAFSGFERRVTTTAAGEHWSGAYYYLQDTYLEFFGSGSNPVGHNAGPGGHWEPGAQEGWAGLAFGVSQPGAAAQVREALADRFHYQPFSELRQLRAGKKTINWFTTVRLTERLGLGSFESWVMEYHLDIFAHKNLPIPPSGELTTAAYLAGWNEGLGDLIGSGKTRLDSAPRRVIKANSGGTVGVSLPPPAPVFSRVTGATIHLDERRAQRYAEVLSALGYQAEHGSGSITLSAHGFELRIRFEPSTPGYRLSALRLAMARPSVAPMTFVFAPRSRLLLKTDLTAEWEFGI